MIEQGLIHRRIRITSTTTTMSSSDRLQQVANHLSNNYGRGLLNGEVAIITGTLLASSNGAPRSRLNFPKVLRRYYPSMQLSPSSFILTFSLLP